MKSHRFVVAACAAVLMMLCVPAAGRAQAMGGPNPKIVPDPGITLKVTVTISRWEGDKKVGSSPFVLMVKPSYGERAERGIDGETVSLQMGSDYPMPATTTMVDGKPAPGLSYKALGTNIRLAAKPADDGKYTLYVSVQDSQVDKPRGTNQTLPSFQTFRAENRLSMRDGQTLQYTVASDATSGQLIKLDVTMNVIK